MAIVLDDGTELDTSLEATAVESNPMDPKASSDEELGAIDVGAVPQTGPVGVGPLASGEEYAMAVNPTLETERQAPAGFGTVARSTAEAIYPYTNETTAALYAQMYPKLNYKQWYDVLTRREQSYRQAYPWGSLGVDVTAAIPSAALAGAAGMSKLAPAVQTAAMMGYGAATGPGVPQKTMDQPGYEDEAAFATGLGAFAPAVGGAVTSTIGTGIANVGKWLDKRWINKIGEKSGDAELKTILNQWQNQPERYFDIADAKEVRTEALNDMFSAVDQINKLYNEKRISLAESNEAFSGIKSKYDDMIRQVEKNAIDKGRAPSGTAKEIEEQFRNFDDYVMGKYSDAWKNAPQTPEWSMNPEANGIPLSMMTDSAESAIRKVLKYRDKSLEEKAVESATRQQVNNWVDTIINNTRQLSDDSTINYIMNNKFQLLNKAERVGAMKNVDAMRMAGTTPAQVADALRRIDFVDPQEVKEYARLLFRGSSGFNMLQDQASLAMQSKIGQDVKKSWYMNWVNNFSKLPHMQRFKEGHDIAYNLNTTFLKPLEDKITIRSANRQQTTSNFVEAAKNTEDQFANSVRAMSQYGNQGKQNLVDLADQLAASDSALKDIKALSLDQAIEAIGKRQNLASEAMQVLGRMDPAMRVQYSELEQLAMRASSQRDIVNQITRETKEFFEKNKNLIGPKAQERPATWLNQFATGRASNVSKADLSDSLAERGLREIQQYMLNGDESAVNSAIDKMRKLREIDILNRKTIQGSKQTVEAGAMGSLVGWGIGKMTGANLAPVLIPAFILADKSAKSFTHGKWTTLQPYLIEKALNRKINFWRAGTMSGMVSGTIARQIKNQQTTDTIRFEPGSQEVSEAINLIKQEKSLTASQKLQTIKKLQEEGINLDI